MAEESRSGAELAERHALPTEMTWRLEDIFATEEQWEAQYAAIREAIGEAEKTVGRVAESAEQLLATMQLCDDVAINIRQVYAYAAMRRDQLTTDSDAQAMLQRAITLYSQVQGAVAHVEPEILAAGDDVIHAYLDQNEDLRVYRHLLHDTLRRKPHILSSREEGLLAQMREVTAGIEVAFEMLNDADMDFGTIQDEDGRDVPLTYERYIRFQRSADRRVRRDSFMGLHAPYAARSNTFAALFRNSVGADVFYARARQHPSALHAALSHDNIPVDVYDNLVEAVRSYIPTLQRYMRLRQQMLGTEDMRLYDMMAPLAPKVDFDVTYDESRVLIKEGLKPLGDEYAAALDLCFDNRWIDVYENRGKMSGAYMRSVYGVHPYILLNYQGTINDVFTLAHELGHAMHSYFTHQSQPFVYAGHSIFVAEVASMANEALLLDHLLQTETDRDRRIFLLSQALDDFCGSVFRQTMFAEFEKATHAAVEQGEALTGDSLRGLFRELLDGYYSPAVTIDDEADIGWARIPHFYSAFYVYQYATGYSAANALARAMLHSEDAVERYHAFLAAGSSDYPLNLLKTAGVDMTAPKAITDALSVFADLVDELEAVKG